MSTCILSPLYLLSFFIYFTSRLISSRFLLYLCLSISITPFLPSSVERDIDPKSILILWESIVPLTASFITSDTLCEVFANCLSDHIRNAEISYSASNIVPVHLNNGVKEVDSQGVNTGDSVRENFKAISSNNKSILSLNMETFQGYDVRLLSRCLADDVSHSFWNVHTSKEKVSAYPYLFTFLTFPFLFTYLPLPTCLSPCTSSFPHYYMPLYCLPSAASCRIC